MVLSSLQIKSGNDLNLIAMISSGAVSRFSTSIELTSYSKESSRLIGQEEVIAHARHEDLRSCMMLTTATGLTLYRIQVINILFKCRSTVMIWDIHL
jgi:hypothetical protein